MASQVALMVITDRSHYSDLEEREAEGLPRWFLCVCVWGGGALTKRMGCGMRLAAGYVAQHLITVTGVRIFPDPPAAHKNT